MQTYQQRQTMLIGLGETAQVGVGQQIGAVLVIAAMGDSQADLVQHRRPAQGLAHGVVGRAFVGGILGPITGP